ncbi:MAG: 4-(cytidine 5'-diphospho)-2-C-methyl-D-erythritol kinase [Magnetococcales bacterium]|nr:4-(cytidine 5'-diphospho)-2-C-methyl-D-erythritol kinase [Magnetococcales bacterium]
MTRVYRFSAPAKINLRLKVVGRRDDGYHLLQTVMVFFPLYDRLTFEHLDAGLLELVCRPEVTCAPEQNLVYRAAALLKERGGVGHGIRIVLEKGIPDAAGLGGGSSDAATTLMALNKIWKCGLDQDQLAALGLKLGADVPFFIGCRSALAEGIGERLTLWNDPPVTSLVLVNPGVPLSTAKVFKKLSRELTNTSSLISMPHAWKTQPQLAFLENDLEPSAITLAPQVDQALTALRQVGAVKAVMSGSGASVFGVFEGDAAARTAANALRARQPEWLVKADQAFHRHPFQKEWRSI